MFRSIIDASKKIGGAWIVIPIILAFALFIATAITKFLWYWIVPDVFAGMVIQELLPASLTWLQAFKITFLLGCLRTNVNKSK